MKLCVVRMIRWLIHSFIYCNGWIDACTYGKRFSTKLTDILELRASSQVPNSKSKSDNIPGPPSSFRLFALSLFCFVDPFQSFQLGRERQRIERRKKDQIKKRERIKLKFLEREKRVMEKSEISTSTVLNCISLSEPDITKSVALLKQACLESGFFYVTNHGISQEFMEEVFSQSKKFFDLPIKEKMKVMRNEKNRGYTPLFDELLDPDNQINGDYKEGYYIGVEIPKEDPQANKPFYGPNQWPSDNILPGWREVMEQYHKEALRVSKEIARIIALALDLDSNFFDKPEMLGEPIATLRLLHYEARASDPTKGVFGAGAHSDYGLITLLATDDVVGLQICKDRNAVPQVWEYVAPLKGGFIVNLGDMLERWSNCIFRSTLHRVVLDGRERYSIAYFVEPSHDCVVECLPSCKSETNPPKFPPVTCSAYLNQRYMETHADLSSYGN
ncbi:hypothetical protein LUZ60_009333 [Juncus effusus]|nr:hypothetical protein LUZ60_009333 [Juncus effusus]